MTRQPLQPTRPPVPLFFDCFELTLGNPLGQANQLGNLSRMAKDQGDYEAAKDYLEQSAELYQRMGLEIHPAVRQMLDILSGIEAGE